MERVDDAGVVRVSYVEVMDRRGELHRRERIERLPLRIGRAYDNDLILDDPHVCPAHAVLELDGAALVLRDVGSVNGLHSGPARERNASVAIASGSTVVLGRTQLRFVAPEHAVAPALHLRARPRWLEWSVTHPLAGLLWLALLLGTAALESVRSSVEKIDWVSEASGLAGVALLAGAWAGGFALIGRLLGQRPRFVAHFAIAVSALLAFDVQVAASEWAQFLLAPIEPQRVLDTLAGSSLFAGVLFAHLTVLHAGRTFRRALVGLTFGALLLGLRLSTLFSEPLDFVAVLPYWSRLEPLAPRWLPVRPADAFFAEVAGLEAELAALRAEALAEAEAAK